MMKNSMLILFFMLIFLCSKGQRLDSLQFLYNNQTIYRYGNYFMKGSERLTFAELSKEFSMSDLGMASYIKAKKYKRTSTVLRVASAVTAFATIAVISNNRNNSNTVYALLGGQLLLGIGSARYGSLSAQSLDRALWQRNKDLLFPQSR